MMKNKLTSIEKINEILWSRIYSYVLEISVELNLYKHLESNKSLTIEEISNFCDLPVTSTRLLLQYLTGLGLIDYKDGEFCLTDISRETLLEPEYANGLLNFVDDSIGGFRKRIKHPNDQPWYTIKDSCGTVENASGISPDFFTSPSQHNWRIENGQSLSVKYDFSKHSALLDIGAASGGWTIGIRKENPHLKCYLFDLPEVCKYTRQMIDGYDERNSLFVVEGDMFNVNKYPEEVDVILLANVLHDWAEKDIITIVENIYNSYETCTLLVQEMFMEDSWKGPLENLYQGILVLGPDNKSGWQPSYVEVEKILRKVGFNKIERRPNLLVAKK